MLLKNLCSHYLFLNNILQSQTVNKHIKYLYVYLNILLANMCELSYLCMRYFVIALIYNIDFKDFEISRF